MVRADNIRKSYGTVQALDGVSLRVGEGEIFGIIGPDGAGKTTLFRILATLILADSGTAAVGGFDVGNDYKEIRKRVGYMPGRFSLYQDMSVEENLAFFAAVFGTTIEENYHLVEDIPRAVVTTVVSFCCTRTSSNERPEKFSNPAFKPSGIPVLFSSFLSEYFAVYSLLLLLFSAP